MPKAGWDASLTARQASERAKELGLTHQSQPQGQFVYQFPQEETAMRRKIFDELYNVLTDGYSRQVLVARLLPQLPQPNKDPNYVPRNTARQ